MKICRSVLSVSSCLSVVLVGAVDRDHSVRGRLQTNNHEGASANRRAQKIVEEEGDFFTSLLLERELQSVLTKAPTKAPTRAPTRPTPPVLPPFPQPVNPPFTPPTNGAPVLPPFPPPANPPFTPPSPAITSAPTEVGGVTTPPPAPAPTTPPPAPAPTTPPPAPTPTTPPPATAPVVAPPTSSGGTLAEKVAGNPGLSTLLFAVDTAGLSGVLGDPTAGPLTVFGPLDDAFVTLGSYVQTLITPGFDLHLTDLLLSHLVIGEILSSSLSDGQQVTMVSGLPVTVQILNGVVSLRPPSVVAGLAPSVDVFSVDDTASNGVLHTVNNVILPDFVFVNPVDALLAQPDVFSTLTGLVTSAGLGDAVGAVEESTLVMPNNEAFTLLSSETAAFLTDPANADVLSQVLLYHVMGQMLPFSILDIGVYDVPTLQGENISVDVSAGSTGGKNIAFNGVPVVGQGFILTQFDLIYELGGVLIPPSLASVIPSSGQTPSYDKPVNMLFV